MSLHHCDPMDTSMLNDSLAALDKTIELEHVVVNEVYALTNEPWHNCIDSIKGHDSPYFCHKATLDPQIVVTPMMEIFFIAVSVSANQRNCS
mmetsp:Transcript_1908/g.3957  ORF Transcript_1908/g.3957 Transcript_1908/m.3957 type:complete len:92 (+) Transcript_1908:1528-1803(+)